MQKEKLKIGAPPRGPSNNPIARLRTACGMTRADLSEKTGIPIRSICGWEYSQKFPRRPIVEKLAAALGVSGRELWNALFDAPPTEVEAGAGTGNQ